MPEHRQHFRSGRRVPNMNGLIASSGNEPRAIGRNTAAIDVADMANEHHQAGRRRLRFVDPAKPSRRIPRRGQSLLRGPACHAAIWLVCGLLKQQRRAARQHVRVGFDESGKGIDSAEHVTREVCPCRSIEVGNQIVCGSRFAFGFEKIEIGQRTFEIGPARALRLLPGQFRKRARTPRSSSGSPEVVGERPMPSEFLLAQKVMCRRLFAKLTVIERNQRRAIAAASRQIRFEIGIQTRPDDERQLRHHWRFG